MWKKCVLGGAFEGASVRLGAVVVAAVVAAFALRPAAAQAQIVNVTQLSGKVVEQGFSGAANATVVSLVGNSLLLTASGGITAYYRRGRWLALVTSAAAYGLGGKDGKFADDPFQSKIFEHVRVRRDISDGWSIEAFGQHEYDRWRRLKLRALAGTGLRLDAEATPEVHAVFGLAYMALWEELLKPTEVDLQGVVFEHRVSSYATLAVALSATSAVTATLYVQPRIDLPSDIRGLIDVGLVVGIVKNLGLRVSWVLGYDTAPPANVRGYDGMTKVEFTATF